VAVAHDEHELCGAVEGRKTTTAGSDQAQIEAKTMGYLSIYVAVASSAHRARRTSPKPDAIADLPCFSASISTFRRRDPRVFCQFTSKFVLS
jgi:hypothetical protein